MDTATASIFAALGGALVAGGLPYLRSLRASKDTTYARQAAVFEDAYLVLTRYGEQGQQSSTLAEDALAAAAAEIAPRLRIVAGREFEAEFLEVLDHLHDARICEVLASSSKEREASEAELIKRFEEAAHRKHSDARLAMNRFADHCAGHLVGRRRLGPGGRAAATARPFGTLLEVTPPAHPA